jgi:hypothetical protein
MHLISDRQCNSPLLDEQESIPRRVLLDPIHRVEKMAKILIRAKSRLASEWIPGDTNRVADSLSRDADISDADLTCTFLYSFPPTCEIKVLPAEIRPWLISLLLHQLPDSSSQRIKCGSQLRLGSVGNRTSARSISTISASYFSSERRPVERPCWLLFHPLRWAISAWQAQPNG